MAKSKERLEACALRRKGHSVKEIAKMLCVSSGSVSIWTRDVSLTDAQRKRLREQQIAAGHRGRMMGAEANKEKKATQIRLAEREAFEKLTSLSNQSLFHIGLGLYWGEGVKAGNGSLAVSNSDPRVITLMIRWFSECFDIEIERFMPRVFISDVHREREEIILTYWAKTLSLPRSQFRKTVFLDRGKKIYENHDMYYGVLALRVSKGGDCKYKILAQIKRIAELSNAGRRSSRVRTRHS